MAETNSSTMQTQANEAVQNTEQTAAAATPAQPSATGPQKPKKIKNKNWFARHKAITVILAVAAVAGVSIGISRYKASKAVSGSAYQYVRTTTLKKTSLNNSVTVSGTVASGSVASVTVADTAKTYKVSSVSVQVGDKVNTGDVICTLDTTDLEKSITSAKQNYNDTLTSTQLAYNRAKDNYDTYSIQHENNLIDFQAKIDQADKNLSDAEQQQKNAQNDYDTAKSAYDGLNTAYNAAKTQIQAFTDAYNGAAASANTSLNNLNGNLANYNAFLNGYLAGSNSFADLVNTANALIQESVNYNGDSAQYLSSVPGAVNNAATQKGETGNYTYTGSQPNADTSFVGQMEKAQKDLTNAQEGCSYLPQGLYGFSAIEKAFQLADTTLSTADKTLSQAKTAVESARQAVQSAHDTYDKEKNYSNLSSLKQNMEDAALKLAQAKRTPDNLTSLQDTLANCTLKATMNGTITALNATVGSACTGTVATIQDTDGLTVEVTIPSNDVVNLTTGMTCRITSDATGDAVIDGTLTQIDPVANDKGTFGAKISVAGDPGKLLIGMQAKAEIFESSADNVFAVPMDAVGTAEDGSRYVLRKTGGEGVNLTFEQVTVTTGTANDYYIEITGDTLAEGDVIRSSADLSVGTETTDATEDPMAMMMGGSGEAMVSAEGGEAPPDADNGGGPRGGGQ